MKIALLAVVAVVCALAYAGVRGDDGSGLITCRLAADPPPSVAYLTQIRTTPENCREAGGKETP